MFECTDHLGEMLVAVALEAYRDWSGEAAGARLCVKKIIAESELLQPALNEIHKFCFQHWSRGRGTCGTGSGAPVVVHFISIELYIWHDKTLTIA